MERGDFKKRKLKESLHDDDSDCDQSEQGDLDLRGPGDHRGFQKGGPIKQNHSEIEKRRRDKMNTYINELSTMIPMCNAMSRKLDKLTVLRMAVQHMRALRGRAVPFTETNYKPAFLSDEDLKNLVLEAADGFLFVVGCDRGRILYVSDSIQNCLNLTQLDLVGNSFYDQVHPRDVVTIKDQLSSFDGALRDKQTNPDTNSKTASPKAEAPKAPTQMCSGARRSFMCRMKSGSKVKKAKADDMDSNLEPCIMNRKSKMKQATSVDKNKQYVIVNFTGYLKSWPPSGCSEEDEEEENDAHNLSCLVAVGRLVEVSDEMTDFTRPDVAKEFASRHSSDGKFIHVDDSITSICGYLPQELIGTSGYDYFHQDDLEIVAQSHKKTLQGDVGVSSYRFLCKAGHYIPLATRSTIFRNPWTKEIEFIICTNTVLTEYDFPMKQQASVIITQPSQRPILPAPSPQSMQPPPKRGVKQLLEVLKRQPGRNSGRKGRASQAASFASTDEGDNANPSAAMIGAILAEEAESEASTTKRQPLLGKPASLPGSAIGGSFAGSSDSGGAGLDFNLLNPGTSSGNDPPRLNVFPQSDMGSIGGPPSFSRPTLSQGPMTEMSQPHLLEQLISMQHAIESMESPMQQSEESMAVFMNMLEADAGLGGEFNDLAFKNNT